MTEIYRLVGRLKNNRLWSAIVEQWPDVKTQAAASRKLSVVQSQLGKILNMQEWPWSRNRDRWTDVAQRIANAVGLSADYLFDAELYGVAPVKVEVEFTPQNMDRLQAAAAGETMLLESAFNDEQKTAIGEALKTLTPAQERVIQDHYLNDDSPVPRMETADRLGVSVARVHQIHLTALRKLRRKSKGLLPYYEDVDGDDFTGRIR